ncbi:hypothetical protein ACHAXT_005045 [Thalassiosira profunda]
MAHSARRKHAELKAKLLSVTKENTELLREVAALKNEHMTLEAELKEAKSYNRQPASQSSSCQQRDIASEKAKQLAQEREIELLKMEIRKLKSKCGHVSEESSRLPLLKGS